MLSTASGEKLLIVSASMGPEPPVPEGAKPGNSYPSPARAWSLVALLTVTYVFSFTDRTILGLLIEPIKSDLALTDTQLGLLLGPAFGILYATMGLPFGWLADRWKRTWIIGIGATVWSLATIASGFARGFAGLFAARMTVGVGEATLSPCAMSLVADSFPPEKRGKPIAFYSMAIVFGSSLAFLLGAFVLGSTSNWQWVFIIVGAAGLLPAVIFFYLAEPTRRAAQLRDESLKGTGIPDAVGYVLRHWKTYGSFVSLMCLMTIIAYAGSWNPAMFERTWGWSAEKYAWINGLVTLPLGITVYWASGWLSDRWTQQGSRDAPLKIMITGALIMAPLYALAPLMPGPWLAFVVLNTGSVGMMMLTAVSVTALLNITPAAIRAQIIAIYYMTISLTGLFIGPTMVGYLSQHWFGEDRLNLAVAAMPVLFGALPLLLIPWTVRLYRAHALRLSA